MRLRRIIILVLAVYGCGHLLVDSGHVRVVQDPVMSQEVGAVKQQGDPPAPTRTPVPRRRIAEQGQTTSVGLTPRVLPTGTPQPATNFRIQRRNIARDETVDLPVFSVVRGDVIANESRYFDSSGSGHIVVLTREAVVTAPFGATAIIGASSEEQATAIAVKESTSMLCDDMMPCWSVRILVSD